MIRFGEAKAATPSKASDPAKKTDTKKEPAQSPVAPAVAPKKMGRPKKDDAKVFVSLRLDPHVLDHYRATGAGWQSRINEDLKKAVGLEKAK